MVRLDKLGGTDWGEEGLKPTTDLNPTFNAIIDASFVGIAQNAYQTLQANNVFENKDSLATDEFVDADGTNDTVNTSSTDAEYDSDNDYYYNGYKYGTVEYDDETAVSSSTTSTFTTTITINNTGYISNFKSVWDGTGDNATITIKKNGTTVVTKTMVTNTGIRTTSIDISEYSELLESGDTVTFKIDGLTGDDIYYKTGQNFSGTNFEYTSQSVSADQYQTMETFGFTPVTQEENAVLVCDTNTLTLTGDEKSICVYGDKLTPTNTEITADISDGTTTLSAQPLNEAVNVSTLSSGTLEITFNLTTTDTNITPYIKGYGIFIK